jgi:hypothetical protein
MRVKILAYRESGVASVLTTTAGRQYTGPTVEFAVVDPGGDVREMAVRPRAFVPEVPVGSVLDVTPVAYLGTTPAKGVSAIQCTDLDGQVIFESWDCEVVAASEAAPSAHTIS